MEKPYCFGQSVSISQQPCKENVPEIINAKEGGQIEEGPLQKVPLINGVTNNVTHRVTNNVTYIFVLRYDGKCR